MLLQLLKTPAQLAVLERLYKNGMVSALCSDQVNEAVAKTSLSRAAVLEWIRNRRKPHRGNKKKSVSKNLNVYTAFLSSSVAEFQGDGKDLGQLTKSRCAEYRKLQGSEEGREVLRETLSVMTPIADEDAVAVEQMGNNEQHKRRQNAVNMMQRQCFELSHLGYKAVVLIVRDQETPLILGTPDAVCYWSETQPYQAVEDFEKHFMGKTAASTIRDVPKTALRKRVQNLFNKLYARASGNAGAVMPYKALAEGLLHHISGLPEGISLKKPILYGIADLQKILLAEATLSFTLCQSTSKSVKPPSIEPTAIEPAAIELATFDPAAMEPAAIELATIDPAGIEPQSVEYAIRDSAETAHDIFLTMAPDTVDDGHDQVILQSMIPVCEEENEVVLQGIPTSAEAIEKIQAKANAKVLKKRKQRGTIGLSQKRQRQDRCHDSHIQDSLVGKKVHWGFDQQLSGRERGTKLVWYYGVVTSDTGRFVSVKFDAETETYRVTKKEFKNYVKSGTLKLIR